MKKLGFIGILFISCISSTAQTPKVKPGAAPSNCVAAPEKLYGADMADCRDFQDLGFCCGYGKSVIIEHQVMACAYMLCRDTCEASWEMNFAICFPTAGGENTEVPQDKNDETL